MASGKGKIQLIIELRDKVRTGLNSARDKINKGVDRIKSKLSEVGKAAKDGLSGLFDKVPALGGLFKSALNPIALVTAAVIGLGTVIAGTVQKAADFESHFRDLSNLNLDKDRGEISRLRNDVLDTAFTKGFDPFKTSEAYSEIQSTTEMYGKEVKEIVSKQGEFANLMKADFNEYVAGTAKAMANFRFGAESLDEFNKSAYAAVKIGVVSFDQLSKVQSVFAGSAASAMQSFDTANKIFALFTVKTKSVDEAATLTKSMFNDLTKQTTIDAFKKVGINVYDNNNKLKQADILLLELNKKFRGLDSDKKLIALKNQFAGSEGLISLIQAATDRTGGLEESLTSFEETKIEVDEALGRAKQDLNYLKEQLSAKWDVALIKIGQIFLPIVTKIVDGVINWIDNTKALYEESQLFQDILKGIGLVFEYSFKIAGACLNHMYNTFLIIKGAISAVFEKVTGFSGGIEDMYSKVRPFFIWMKDFICQIGDIMVDVFSLNYKGVRDKIKNFKLPEVKTTKTEKPDKLLDTSTLGNNPVLSPDTNTPTSGGSLGSSANSVTGSAKQIRNITVNIEAFNKGGINTQNTNLQKMDSDQIEDWFVNTCMKAIRNVELSYT